MNDFLSRISQGSETGIKTIYYNYGKNNSLVRLQIQSKQIATEKIFYISYEIIIAHYR